MLHDLSELFDGVPMNDKRDGQYERLHVARMFIKISLATLGLKPLEALVGLLATPAILVILGMLSNKDAL